MSLVVLALLLQAEPEPATEYIRLAQLSGQKYAIARKAFLARPECVDYLAGRIEQQPDDWLALALWTRAKQPQLVAMFGRIAHSKPAPFPKRDFGPEVFDWDAFKRLPEQPRLVSTDPQVAKVCENFDWMAEFALELEWWIRNPDEQSPGTRFWMLQGLLTFMPVEPSELKNGFWTFYDKPAPYVKQAFATVDAARSKAWLEYCLVHERDRLVRLCVAARLPGDRSVAILRSLAEREVWLGAVAALMYAGRESGHALGAGHPFQGAWLEKWATLATAEQLAAVDVIFRLHTNEPLVKVSPPNHRVLGVPALVAGLFAKHHPDSVEQCKATYAYAVEDSFQMFSLPLDGYTPADDFDQLGLKQAQRYLQASSLWPATYAAKLDKISTRNAQARNLIEKARAGLGKSEYPDGAQLQSLFGDP